MIHLHTFPELQQYVLQVLCARADLDLNTPIFESTIYRHGQACGIEYLLLAPRSIRLSAIWDAERGRLLFYDHDLTRFQMNAVHGPNRQDIDQRPRPKIQVKSLWRGK